MYWHLKITPQNNFQCLFLTSQIIYQLRLWILCYEVVPFFSGTFFRLQQQGKLTKEHLEEAGVEMDEEGVEDSDDETEHDDQERMENICSENDETEPEKSSNP